MKVKAIIIAVVIAAVVAFVIFAPDSDRISRMPVAEGFKAPDISLVDFSGQPWQLAAERGNVVLINYWATW